MGRPPCCDKSTVKRGLWTAEEDAKILAYVANHGTGNWTSVPKKAGLKRCGKSCRLRYTNYLRPDIKRESFTPQEEEIIISLHATIGSRWSVIAQRLPGRTDNDVKNYWNTKLKKKLFQKGIDPVTHRPISHILQSLGGLPTPTSMTTTNSSSSSRGPHHLNHNHKGGGPRMISCLNRDLKSIFTSRGPDLLSSAAAAAAATSSSAAAASTSPPAYDLLTQLHAIQLVTGAAVPNATSSAAAADPPSCGAPAEAPGELSWSDFLVDDVVLCLLEDGGDGGGGGATEGKGGGKVVEEEEEEETLGFGGECNNGGGGEEGSEVGWEFPELLVDEGFDFGDVFDV